MNLYAKIFIGFWLSMIAIIGSWMLAGQYFAPIPEDAVQRDFSADYRPEKGFPRPGPERPGVDGDFHRLPPGGPPPGPAGPMRPPRAMYGILYVLQNMPETELLPWIEKQEKSHRMKIFLLEGERDIFERELIPGVEEVLDRLAGFRRRTALREGDTTLFGQEIYRQGRGQLTAVMAIVPPASRVVQILTEHLWLRLLLAIIISGLISYAVSRYLTRPLKQLQLASRKLAGGDLATRIAVPQRGGDETDELARDFNSMAEQMQQQMQARERLLRDVSHELRSPLARLRVALALAEKEPQKSAEQLQRIERETERLDELIGQLLSVPEGKVALDDSIDLAGLLRELCEDADFEAQQEGKSVEYHTELPEAVVKSHGDLLKKALENVIRNALAYTPTGTAAQVRLRREDNHYQIAVTDHGPGVPESELGRIFEPFYRVDSARQRETGGYGLGLSISARSIGQHGGAISASNTGTGLCVLIRLPA